MASEQDRTPEQLLRLFNNEVETGLRLLRRMQREFSNQATTSGENTLDGRLADAIQLLQESWSRQQVLHWNLQTLSFRSA